MTDVLDHLATLAPRGVADRVGLLSARALLDASLDHDEQTGVAALEQALVLAPAKVGRRRARAAVSVAASVTLLGAAGLGVTLLRAEPVQALRLDDAGALVPAAPGDPACLTDPLAPAPASQQLGPDASTHLPAGARELAVAAGSVPRSVRLEAEAYPCGAPEPAAVFAARDGSVAVTFYAATASPTFSGAPVQVRGRAGRVATPPAGHHFLTWREPDGVRWTVVANGMTSDDLVEALADADLRGTTVGGSTALLGLPRETPPPAAEDWTDVTFVWTVDLGVQQGPTDQAAAATLLVQAGPEESLGARLSWASPGRVMTTVRSVPAAFVPWSEGGSSLSWVVDGRSYVLLVEAHSLDLSRAIAERLVPTSADDARVLAAWER